MAIWYEYASVLKTCCDAMCPKSVFFWFWILDFLRRKSWRSRSYSSSLRRRGQEPGDFGVERFRHRSSILRRGSLVVPSKRYLPERLYPASWRSMDLSSLADWELPLVGMTPIWASSDVVIHATQRRNHIVLVTCSKFSTLGNRRECSSMQLRQMTLLWGPRVRASKVSGVFKNTPIGGRVLTGRVLRRQDVKAIDIQLMLGLPRARASKQHLCVRKVSASEPVEFKDEKEWKKDRAMELYSAVTRPK